MSINPQRAAKNDRGFALLITITLLAFLVLLLVSLASLTRVETQVAANNQQLAQARQNALMAMNVALGRLQQLAGPDQRVTGTADLVPGVNVSKQKWTGVWKWDTAAPTTPAWLVSTASTASSTGNASATSALPAAGTVTLVGAGSTDITIVGNEVKVETQSISSDAVPGFSGLQTVGNFAYWVGDEGVKAKVSVTDPWESPANATVAVTMPTLTPAEAQAQAQTYRFMGTLRTGVEGVGKNAADDRVGSAYPFDPSLNPTSYQEFKSSLPKVLSPRQLAMANPAASADLASAAKARFHDLTASSVSVMANVVDGGLKKDLTAWLSKPDGPANLPRDTDYIANSATYMPRWSQIRSYAGMVADGTPKAPVFQDATALPTTLVTASAAAPKQGVYPVITYARLGYNVSCAGPDQPIAFHLFPVVTLWNPYNVPLAAHDYEMRWDDQDWYNAIVVGKQTATDNTQRPASYDKWKGPYSEAFATGYFAYGVVAAANENVGAYPKTPLRFRLKAPRIEPGQSLIFTLKDPVSGAADTYQARINEMEPFAPNQSDNSVVIYGPTMTAADLTSRYFMSNTGGQQQLSLRDYVDPNIVYQWMQNPTSLARFSSSPVNSSFLIENPGVVAAPKLYVRAGLYQSQGQNGPLANPAAWFSINSRWLALFNPLAPHSLRLGGGKTASFSYFMDTQGITNPGPAFGSGNRASVGPGEDVSIPASDLVVHEFLKSGAPLVSLAQLQHANVSQMNLYPAYAIGNSLASVYVPRDKTVYTVGSGPSGSPTGQPQQLPFRNLTEIHDLSYVLNRALWDKYFFSTVPASLTSPTQITADYKLPNSRHVFGWKDGVTTPSAAEFAELKTTEAAAAHLLIDGGFNVNSTSVQAWRALLYSRNGIATDPADAATYKHPYSRYTDSAAGVSNSTPWQGYRVLSDTQIDNLAVKIVEQVKLRGPFVSLADFVNRRLVAAPAPSGLKGALQAAIDAVDADAAIAVENRINARSPFTDRNTGSGIDTGISILATAVNAIPKQTDTDVIRAHWIGDDNDTNANKAHASRAAFAPGYLSQADLLTSLGPVLTPRSDTFTIRAYGDVQNPSTASVEARAWCEAVVQRLPDYMETLDAWAPPVPGTNNEKFGRRFRVVSFRWLTAGEI